jgi:hypothetical protein
MKKILLTTSALTLLAGAAAAESSVNLNGYARIGISNSTAPVSATDSTKVGTVNYLRNRLTFSGSATSDGGLTFSTWARWRHSASSNKFAALQGISAPNFTVSNGAITLVMGNGTGAMGSYGGIWGCGGVMWGCYGNVDQSYDHASGASTGTGPDVVRLDMALGSATVSVSGGNGNDSEVALAMPLGGGSVNVGYDAGSATASVAAVAARAETLGSVSGTTYTAGVTGRASAAEQAAVAAKPTVHVGYAGSMSGLDVGIRVAQKDSKTGYAANVTAPVGAGSVRVFAGKSLQQDNIYGLTYSQSLGGSVAMHAGMASKAGNTQIGAGLAFSF